MGGVGVDVRGMVVKGGEGPGKVPEGGGAAGGLVCWWS